jgi:hypothetical protein
MNKNFLLKVVTALTLDVWVAGYKGYGATSEGLKTFGKALAWSGIVSTLPAVAGSFAGSNFSDKPLYQTVAGVVGAGALTCALETEPVRTKIPGFGKIDVANDKELKSSGTVIDLINTTLQVLAFNAIDYYCTSERDITTANPEIGGEEVLVLSH